MRVCSNCFNPKDEYGQILKRLRLFTKNDVEKNIPGVFKV